MLCVNYLAILESRRWLIFISSNEYSCFPYGAAQAWRDGAMVIMSFIKITLLAIISLIVDLGANKEQSFEMA
jgi:hypothetical protein